MILGRYVEGGLAHQKRLHCRDRNKYQRVCCRPIEFSRMLAIPAPAEQRIRRGTCLRGCIPRSLCGRLLCARFGPLGRVWHRWLLRRAWALRYLREGRSRLLPDWSRVWHRVQLAIGHGPDWVCACVAVWSVTPGPLLTAMLDQGAPHGRAVGIDSSVEMIGYTQPFIPAHIGFPFVDGVSRIDLRPQNSSRYVLGLACGWWF